MLELCRKKSMFPTCGDGQISFGKIYTFPRKLWKRLRTSNVVERFNRELRRRTRVVSIFPSEKSTLRLVGALLIETHEEWINGPRYLDVETIQSFRPEEGIYRKMVA